jgi:glycosyltransferase involved in cell wall biosynthesis
MSNAESYDVVQIEHEEFAPLLPRRRSNRWAITLHNLISVRWRQRAAISEKRRVRWLFESDAARSERFERWITNSFDLTITMSHEDAALLDGPAVVVPNGVDLDRFRLSPLPTQPVFLFSASFNWEPNIDGAVWFCEQVLPLVRQSLPDATLLLVGRKPDVRVRRLLDLPGVEAQFDVPSVVPFLESARIAVVPVRMGSGTRLKALEAMAVGRPVAGTAVGLEGLGLKDGVSAVVADEPDALAARVVRLCTDDVLARRLAEAARPLAEQLSWDRVADRYLDQLLAEPPRSAMA